MDVGIAKERYVGTTSNGEGTGYPVYRMLCE